MIRARLFGHFQLLVDGEPVAFPTAKVGELAAYLLWNRDWVNRAELRYALWPDSTPERASASLRQAVYLLRRTLEDAGAHGNLQVRRSAIRIASSDPGELRVDAREFMQMPAKRHKVGAKKPIPMAMLGEIGKAELLVNMDAPWVDRAQDRVRERYLLFIADAVGKLSESGEYTVAIPHARRWLEVDPLNEHVHRMLMSLYDCSGNPAAARMQFEQCAEALQRELGVLPDPATRLLAGELGIE